MASGLGGPPSSRTLPRFVSHRTVLAPGSLRYNPCDDLIFPSVVAARAGDSRGRWMMYYSPHDAPGGICLAYADVLTGPWREHEDNPVISADWRPHYRVSHVASPHALWSEQSGRYLLYFHGENDTTRVASSADGVHFVYDDIAMTTAQCDGISEASYARVFALPPGQAPGRYVMLFMGNNEGTRRIYVAFSEDGRRFRARPAPLISPPPGTGVTQVGGPWYVDRGGSHYVIFHGDCAGPRLANLTTDLYTARVTPDFRAAEHLGVLCDRREFGAENARVSDPCLLEDDNTLHLFVAIGGRLAQRIGLALNGGQIERRAVVETSRRVASPSLNRAS